MQKCGGNIAGAIRYSRPRGFNIAGASAPAVPTPLGGAISSNWGGGLATIWGPVPPAPPWNRQYALRVGNETGRRDV